MQDDFDSATTVSGQPTPPPAQPPIQPPRRAQPAPPAPQQGHAAPYNGPTQTLPPAAYTPQPSGPPVYVPPGYTPPAPTLPVPVRPPLPSGRPPALPAPRPPLPSGRPPAPPAPPRPPAYSGRPGGPGGPGHPGQPRRWAAWIPLPHALLIISVALLYVATLLPWAVSSSGALIMLQSASVSTLPTQSTGSALQTADNLVDAVGVLSAGLLFFNVILSGLNRLLGGGCVAGCAVAPLYPILISLVTLLGLVILLAAGFGGFGALGQLPVVQSYGLGSLGAAHYEPGYYVWYTGLMVNVAGMFGEFVVRR